MDSTKISSSRLHLFSLLLFFLTFLPPHTVSARSVGIFTDLDTSGLDDHSSWYMQAMQISEAHEYSLGQGVVMALIDSGVDMQHPALQRCIDRTLSYNVADDDYDVTDYLGHGTMMAGLICGSCDVGMDFCGVAPESRLIVYKITRGSGFTFTDDDLAEAITLAADGPARIINLSLVIDDSEIVRNAVQYAMARGKIVVAAAGNYGGVVTFPASIDGVVATGGVDYRFDPISGSGTGPYLIVSAPGYNISTTDAGGGYTATTGTSGAAALVCGTFALLEAMRPSLTPGSARALVAQNSLDVGWPGFDNEHGFGIVNALYSVTGTNPLQSDPARPIAVYLDGNRSEYGYHDKVTLSLGLRGVGGQTADIWIQETDPRGKRFYFQYGVNGTSDLPYPYNQQLGSPFLFPVGDPLVYPLFSSREPPLLSDGTISPDAPEGLYEMTVGLEMEKKFYHSRIVLWIGDDQ